MLQNHQLYFSLGSNLGNRVEHLRFGLRELARHFQEQHCSSVVQSEAWGYEDPNPYLNMAVGFTTDKSIMEIRNIILGIESEAGRQRSTQSTSTYEARTLDIDLLFYGSQEFKNPEMQVPHPRMHLRNFVLSPMAELAPDFVHPVLEKTMRTLLKESPDKSSLKEYAPGL